MSEKIAENKVVQFHYVLTDESGEQLESSYEQEQPMTYLHGHKNIIPGLEKALDNKASGDKFTINVPPEEAYGPYQDSAVGRIAIKHLTFEGKKLKAGDIAQIETKEGARFVVVKKAGKFMADIDGNHPFAGKTLTFNVEVVSVREAQAEELEHGHAHGPGGHHHD
jgi:FKBP-type peptidyl-prolyl cis-trans isomerase SlyD